MKQANRKHEIDNDLQCRRPIVLVWKVAILSDIAMALGWYIRPPKKKVTS